MKTILLTAACAAALLPSITSAAKAAPKKKYVPKVVIGAKLGANFQQMAGSGMTTFSTSYKPGILGGLFLGIDKRKAGIRVEGLVKTARFEVVSNTPHYHVKTLSVDIPVLYEHKIVRRVWVQVGPQFTSLINAKRDLGSPNYKGFMRTADIAIAGGLEVILPIRVTIGARYIKGFVNVNNSASLPGKWNNTSMQFSVGYRFLN